jgi:hypothetical protein
MIGFTGGETAIQVGVAACAAMVTGLLVSGLSDYNARFYYDIGLAGGFALSMLFMRRIARLRFR